MMYVSGLCLGKVSYGHLTSLHYIECLFHCNILLDICSYIHNNLSLSASVGV